MLHLCDAPFGVGITFQVMTVALQSTGDHDAIDSLLERFENQ